MFVYIVQIFPNVEQFFMSWCIWMFKFLQVGPSVTYPTDTPRTSRLPRNDGDVVWVQEQLVHFLETSILEKLCFQMIKHLQVRLRDNIYSLWLDSIKLHLNIWFKINDQRMQLSKQEVWRVVGCPVTFCPILSRKLLEFCSKRGGKWRLYGKYKCQGPLPLTLEIRS